MTNQPEGSEADRAEQSSPPDSEDDRLIDIAEADPADAVEQSKSVEAEEEFPNDSERGV
ncbi:MAG: hypothetical protein JO214_18810 [Frankiaceae bacterium]|nr:hypothetical protein [Frankiaceae bacterium]